ncbi:MAG: 2-oxoacid:acceptor oxidoreductase family protein [Armatimonadetes bacterium]|nr:2-oxoacid:acceptor oxidoreductase family protein [Armatimonadota bacterium]
MSKTEILVTGFGGQGVILLAYIIGKTASLWEGKHATMIQSFGPEARGSACSAEVLVSDKRVGFPYLKEADVLVALSQEGYEQHEAQLRPEGILIYEDALVKPKPPQKNMKYFPISSTRIAEELGRKMVQNMVVLGFFTAVTGAIRPESAREAIRKSVPKGTEELNLKAFDQGFNYAERHQTVQKI